MACSEHLEEAHVVIVLSIKEQDLEVAVHVRAVGVHLAIHLVAFPWLLLMTVIDAIVRAQTHCSTPHITLQFSYFFPFT